MQTPAIHYSGVLLHSGWRVVCRQVADKSSTQTTTERSNLLAAKANTSFWYSTIYCLHPNSIQQPPATTCQLVADYIGFLGDLWLVGPPVHGALEIATCWGQPVFPP